MLYSTFSIFVGLCILIPFVGLAVERNVELNGGRFVLFTGPLDLKPPKTPEK